MIAAKAKSTTSFDGFADSEKRISLSKAAKLVPSGRTKTGRASRHTLQYWVRHGVTRNGEKIYLQHFRYGSQIVTTAEAVRRFLKELNNDIQVDVIAVRSPTKRLKDSERAAAELDRMGVPKGKKPKR